MGQIRLANTDDLEAVCAIYDAARRFMHANGNPSQWPGSYPDLIDAECDLRVDALWVLDEVLNKKFDARLAALLLEEAGYAGEDTVRTTHEKLAAHLGTVREAVSRMLRYFEEEGYVSLFRGGVRIEDRAALASLAEERK